MNLKGNNHNSPERKKLFSTHLSISDAKMQSGAEDPD